MGKKDKYEALRIEMVRRQVKGRGVSDERVLRAMDRVPRHIFVPEDLKEESYSDYPLPVGEGQTISQPYIVGLMTEHLALKGGERVLEIGTGSGYQTAMLAELAKKVYTVERIERLGLKAREAAALLGIDNVEFRIGDGSLGWEDEAPFDRILVTAAAPAVPEALTSQLAAGGRMVIPVGQKALQDLVIVKKENGNLTTKKAEGCVFVPLIGEYGHEI